MTVKNRIIGVVGQWEREAIGERTSSAMASMRQRGLYTGGAARYGYRAGADGALAEDAAEQAVIAAVCELRAAGLSLRRVAVELERRGMLTRGGRRFDAAAIQRIENDAEPRNPDSLPFKRPMNGAIVVGYVRTSTKSQASSIETQRTSLAEFCRRMDADLVAVFEDHGISGANSKRAGLAAALAALAAMGAAVLLVTSRDRLARGLTLAGRIDADVKASGATVVSISGCDGGPEYQLMKQIGTMLEDAGEARAREIIRELSATGLTADQIMASLRD